MSIKKCLALLCLFSTISTFAKELYKNGFEQKNDVRFLAVCAPKWISSQKRAEKEGFIKVNRAGLSGFQEKNHGGVQSYALDVTLLKGSGKWGPSCMFHGGNFNIPVDRDLWLSAYIYPDELPPDVSIHMGIVFTFEKNGKVVTGNLPIKSLGRNMDNFLVYSGNIKDVLKNRFKNVVLKSWMLRLYSRKPFHGQRVKLFLDDVVLSDTKPDVSLTGLSKDRLGNDIIKNADNPYIVDYISLYREYPKNAANVIFNSGFELGMKDWYPRTVRIGDSTELPDPAAIFRISEKQDAPQGNRFFSFKRGGKASKVILSGRPYKIEDGKDYVLSFYARASENGEILDVNNRKIKLTNQWKRYVVDFPKIQCYQTWRKKKYPGRFNLMFKSSGKADIDLDAVMLQKAPLRDYSGSGIIEIAAKPVKQFGLYALGEKPEFKVEYFNSGNKAKKGKLTWQIKDHLHKTIEKGEREISTQAHSGGSFDITVKTDKNFCKLYVKLSSSGQPEQTVTTSAARIPDLSNIKGNEFFGHCAIEGSNPPNLKYTLDLNKKLGMSFAVAYHLNHPRAPRDWRKDNPIFKKIDDLLAIMALYNMEMVWSNYPPFPPGMKKDKDGVEIVTPKVEKDVRDYAEIMARRYRGKIRYFEYFGEYLKDSLSKQSKNVDRLVRAAAEGLKKGNPEAILMTPGQHRMESILTVFPTLAKLGTFQVADRISLHTYGFGSGLDRHNTLEVLKKQIKRHAPGKKVVCTEAGTCSTDTLYYDDICGENLFYPTYKTELEQAVWDTRAQLMTFGSGIFEQNALFYSYEGNVFGRKFYHFINPDNEISPRPVFPAYVNLVNRLSGARIIGEFQQRKKNGLQGYLFKKNGKYFAALWRYTPDHIRRKIIIGIPSSRVKAWDIVGNPLSLKTATSTNILLGDEPVFLDFENQTEKKLLEALHSLHVVLVKPELACDGKNLKIKVESQDNAPLKGSLFLNSKLIAKNIRIAGGKVNEWSVPLKNPEQLTPWQAVFKTDSGENFYSDKVCFLPIARAEKGIRIDGNLKDFSAAQPVLLGKEQAFSNYHVKVKSKQDLSSVTRFLYDSKNFYIAVEVTDDIYRTPLSSANRLWANDALQLLFVLSGNPDALSNEIIELAVSAVDNQPKASFTFGKEAKFTDFPMNITRKDGLTVFELAIPWNLLQKGYVPDPGKHPLFNLAVSDNDGRKIHRIEFLKGYEKSLQMSKGLVDSKNPSLALRLCFLQ